MNNSSYNVDFEKWNKVILRTQLLIAGCVFFIEILDNYLLYITRSQGYGPDTIVSKLIRYLLITTVINFGAIIIGQLLIHNKTSQGFKKLITMLCTVIICTDVAFSHYQFSCTLVVFIAPVMLSILYEDKELASVTLVLSLIGQTIGIIARAMDPVYSKDMGPESVIAYMYTIGTYVISRIILHTLSNRRKELGDALIKAEQATANEEKIMLSLKLFEALAKAIDAKDKYTNGHSARVAVYSTLLAQRLGWDDQQIEKLRYEALLHDIGKIGVPDAILNKPERLTNTEFSIIQSHTVVGSNILKDMIALPEAKRVANYHHERFDGKGYPAGLRGEDIPFNARIVGIADAYDAMNSDRIYRKALSRDRIREELVNGRGTQFDPFLLDLFLELFDDNKLDVKIDSSRFAEYNRDQEYILEDIERVLRGFEQLNYNNIAYTDFEKFYKYMRNIGIRYNRTIEVLSFKAVPEQNVDDNEEDKAVVSELLKIAIQKNIRAVDVYFQYSDYEHVVILLDAGKDNIHIIAQRVIFDFKNSVVGKMYNIVYKLNEKVDEEQ